MVSGAESRVISDVVNAEIGVEKTGVILAGGLIDSNYGGAELGPNCLQ
jgi:hypothetical protein